MSNKYNNEEQSVLQKIQNQTGCLLLVIGVAMLAFVLTDLVSSGSSIFSSNDNSIGEIADQPVSYDEFNQTFVIVTHNRELAKMSDRMLEMKDGNIV